jgi:hypothetical protein
MAKGDRYVTIYFHCSPSHCARVSGRPWTSAHRLPARVYFPGLLSLALLTIPALDANCHFSFLPAYPKLQEVFADHCYQRKHGF